MDNLKSIRDSFRVYFDSPTIELPERISFESVETIDSLDSGWLIKYKLEKLNGRCFLDFYACHRMTNSRHQRILDNGDIVYLENFWEFGYDFYDGEPERTEREKNEKIKKNLEVEGILRSKGFI